MNLVCAAGLLVFVLVAGQPLTGYTPLTYAIFVASAIVTQIIGYFSIIYALGHLPASIVSPTLVGQPVLSALLAIPLAGEIPNLSVWAGGAVVLVGILLIHKSQQGKKG